MAEKRSSNGRFMKTCPSICATMIRRPPGYIEHPRSPTRRALGVVQRTQNSWFRLNISEHVALVEGMITQCQTIRSGVEQNSRMGRGQTHATRCVLAVDDHEVEAPVATQGRQALGDRSAACPAHHITQEKDFHVVALIAKRDVDKIIGQCVDRT